MRMSESVMKKYTLILFLCCMPLVFLLMLNGCGNSVEAIPTPEHTKQPTPEPAWQPTPEPAVQETPIPIPEQVVEYIVIRGERYSTALTSLKLYYEDLRNEDIVPLMYMTNLTELELRNSYPISDLTPLAGLTNLTSLSLSQNQISDLTPLAVLTNLSKLYLSNNRIIDLTPLAGLTNLSKLYLDDNHIFEWSPVAHVPDVMGETEQTGVILSAYEAQNLLKKRHNLHEVSYKPEMDEEEGGVQIYGFMVDYAANMISATSAAYKYCYAWVNSVTRHVEFKEAGPYLYSNIPNSTFPIPTRDGTVIPYAGFFPPAYIMGLTYLYNDKSVIQSYQAQLREAGFVDYGNVSAITSMWIYERASDGERLYAEFRYNEYTEGFSLAMNAGY